MNKIYVLDEFLQKPFAYLRFFEKKIVFTNGCFDIVHNGHLDYLKKASQLGDVLIVGVNTDESIKRLKGANRPINTIQNRLNFLSYLYFVDYIIPFEDDTPIRLIQSITPDVLVKGADYNINEIVGYDWVVSHGGEVKTIQLLEGFSTSSIINKIKS